MKQEFFWKKQLNLIINQTYGGYKRSLQERLKDWWTNDYNSIVIFNEYKDKLPILKNLDKSLKQLKIDVDKIYLQFATEENKKREEFYKATGEKSFANSIKVDQSELMEPTHGDKMTDFPKKEQRL